MAYSLIAESNTSVDWNRLHSYIFARGMSIELIPLPGDNIKNRDALGISIPQKSINEKSLGELRNVVLILEKELNMKIFDLYWGTEINSSNIDELVKQLSE
jgi:hypothetical protein